MAIDKITATCEPAGRADPMLVVSRFGWSSDENFVGFGTIALGVRESLVPWSFKRRSAVLRQATALTSFAAVPVLKVDVPKGILYGAYRARKAVSGVLRRPFNEDGV